jgi:hypothetical protein
VSISSIFRFLYWMRERMESRVVWGTSDTIILSYPIISLIRVDFPTFGLPIKQILIIFFILMFLISAPRVLEKPSSGRTRNSSKLSSSKSSFYYGLGLIFLKSFSHSFILNSLWVLYFSISAFSFSITFSKRYSLAFFLWAWASFTSRGIESLT